MKEKEGAQGGDAGLQDALYQYKMLYVFPPAPRPQQVFGNKDYVPTEATAVVG